MWKLVLVKPGSWSSFYGSGLPFVQEPCRFSWRVTCYGCSAWASVKFLTFLRRFKSWFPFVLWFEYNSFLMSPRSFAIVAAFKACSKVKGSRWIVVGDGNVEQKKGKNVQLKTLTCLSDVSTFLKNIRTMKQTRGILGRFNCAKWKVEKQSLGCWVLLNYVNQTYLFLPPINTHPALTNQPRIALRIFPSEYTSARGV